MKDFSNDPKQQVILAAAWKVFSTYGFRKTSMDDIARAAGVSRPAIYLHFRNKEDLFRSLVQVCYDRTEEALTQALARPADAGLAAFLGAAFEAQGVALAEVMLTSPHGMELLDSGTTVAPDIVAAGEARLTQAYAGWLDAARRDGGARFEGTPQDVAATITAALKGIKMTAPDPAAYLAGTRQLAQLLAAGLAAR